MILRDHKPSNSGKCATKLAVELSVEDPGPNLEESSRQLKTMLLLAYLVPVVVWVAVTVTRVFGYSVNKYSSNW